MESPEANGNYVNNTPDVKQENGGKDGKKGQWLNGIENLLGGGYMSFGDSKKRSSTLKSLTKQMSTIGSKTSLGIASLSKMVQERTSVLDPPVNHSQIP